MDANQCETMAEHEIKEQQGRPPVKGNLRTSIYLKMETINMQQQPTKYNEINEIIHKQACERGSARGTISSNGSVNEGAQMRLLPKLYIQDMPKEALGNNWSVN